MKTISEEHLALIRTEAKKFANRVTGVDWRDCMTSGYIGLLDAQESFDPSRGFKFTTYAAHRVRGAIQDGFRMENNTRRRNRPAHPVSLSKADQFVSSRPYQSSVDEQDEVDRLTRGVPRKYRKAIGMMIQGYEKQEVAKSLRVKPQRLQYLIRSKIRPMVQKNIDEKGS